VRSEVASPDPYEIAFDPARADFSEMNERHVRDFFIGEVRRKTFVRVDEKGTEVAAVISVGMRLTSMQIRGRKLTFDRPFYSGIMGQKAGMPLFIGIMANPAAREFQSEARRSKKRRGSDRAPPLRIILQPAFFTWLGFFQK
jgi:hypothetical protein